MIFEGVSSHSRGCSTQTSAHLGALLTLSGWAGFLRRLELVDQDLSEDEANRSFVAARMAVIDGYSDLGQFKERCLPFEGFLEALVRLSLTKALPTDADIAAARCADAGTYVLQLKDGDTSEYHDFLDTRVAAQPVWRATEHLINLIIRTIERATGTGASENGKLSAMEVKKWLSKTTF